MTIDRQIAESFQPEVKELERLLDVAVMALEFYADAVNAEKPELAQGVLWRIDWTRGK